MKRTSILLLAAACLIFQGCEKPSPPVSGPIPTSAPRAFITAENREAFRQYCLAGGGKDFFSQLRQEFDRDFLNLPFPDEPENFGDPDPYKRTSDKVDKWRAAQATCNVAAGTAEAATILWIVTGEERYLAKAKAFLLAACQWDPSGTTGIQYNDEAHFRFWRKLPFVFDQIRNELSPQEKARILEAFRKRGNESFELVNRDLNRSKRNSIEDETASHGVRFASMTGIAGLALLDDLPEARGWLERSVRFYAEQFPPWGGDDGGWGEGLAYWRGSIEHGRFQDALFLAGHPEAWKNPFWRQTGYFPLYFVWPQATTQFGDTPSAGKLRLEPQMSNFIRRLARQFQDGYLLAYAELANASEVYKQGLNTTRQHYPTGMEFLLQNFAGSRLPVPGEQSLAELPAGRWFRDVDWVSMHSALGQPKDDIMLSFKSSFYGSYSHSHADQNAFIVNAYGENLAINAGYREFHRSPHHVNYTRQTVSKNAILIGGRGQVAQSAEARGKILRLESGPRFHWTTGDATEAYNAGLETPAADLVTRDIVFVDRRYFVVRDVVRLREAQPVSWLLHAEEPVAWDSGRGTALIRRNEARLHVKLVAVGNTLQAEVDGSFPVAFDPKYALQGYVDQSHFTATTRDSSREHQIYAVLWPSRASVADGLLEASTQPDGTITILRPDGGRDAIRFDGDQLTVTTLNP